MMVAPRGVYGRARAADCRGRIEPPGWAPVIILGINCFSHDTAAALLRDGEPVAFVEEERFNREKHTKAFPDRAIEFCLHEAGIGIRGVDAVALAHKAGLDLRRGMAGLLRGQASAG